MPQLPQWHGAVLRSKHPSLSGGPHLVSGSSQRKGATHALATQRCPSGQALPQAPQWAALVRVSTQASPQAVSMRRMGVLIGMMSPFTAQPGTHTESTGVVLLGIVRAMPRRPEPLVPQHRTSPFERRAQVYTKPAAISTASVSPVTATGVERRMAVPSPSSPK
jgi:hypothetical protein